MSGFDSQSNSKLVQLQNLQVTFIWACEYDLVDVVKELLNDKSNKITHFNQPNSNNGKTGVHYVCKKGNIEMLEEMLENKSKLNFE